MGRRIKERNHKRRKVSLTRKRRKTGKSRYSKRNHKRKMLGGARRGGLPFTHTHEFPHDRVSQAVEDKQKLEDAIQTLAEIRKLIEDCHAVLTRSAPANLDDHRTLFRNLKDINFADFGQKSFQKLLEKASRI